MYQGANGQQRTLDAAEDGLGLGDEGERVFVDTAEVGAVFLAGDPRNLPIVGPKELSDRAM